MTKDNNYTFLVLVLVLNVKQKYLLGNLDGIVFEYKKSMLPTISILFLSEHH